MAESRHTPEGMRTGHSKWIHAGSLSTAAFLLLGVTVAFAVDGRGCVASPLHGTAVAFSSTASSVPVTFQGLVNKDTVRVFAVANTPSNTPGLFGGFSTTLGDLPVDTTNDQFNGALNVPRAVWPSEGVIGFKLYEVLSNGSTQELDSYQAQQVPTSHRIVGVADQPDANKFPANSPNSADLNPTAFGFPNQGNSKFLVRAGTDNTARDYYLQPNIPRTLDAFMTSLAMQQVLAYAVYKNDGDLGFGRAMVCGSSTDSGAGFPSVFGCAVSNYANSDDALVDRGRIATVAMNIFPSGSAEPRFVVYGADGAQLETAALDAGGNKPVPNLCLNCHGGRALTGSELVNSSPIRTTDARFLPFDLEVLSVSSGVTNQIGDQGPGFRALNRVVFLTEYITAVTQTTPPPTQPPTALGVNLSLMQLIIDWYASSGGLFSDASSFDKKYVPSGWSGNPALYRGVVAPYCRSCHIAQANRAFDTLQQFKDFKSIIKSAVCDRTGIVMPQAQRVYHRMWASGASAVLAFELGFSTCSFKSF